MPELLFLRGSDLSIRAPITGDRVTLGRSPDATFSIPDKTVSRTQCELLRRGDVWLLLDRSGHGTQVSNRTAHDGGTALRDGDEIRLGVFSVVFSLAAPPVIAEVTAARRTRRGKTGPLAGAVTGLRGSLRRTTRDGESVVPLRAEEGFQITIGSEPTGPLQMQLEDPHVSTEHARITFLKGHWRLQDLGSKNGTWVDGVCVLDAILGVTAAIRIGETVLYFRQDSPGGRAEDFALPGLIAKDPAMQPVVESIRRIAPVKVPVFIHGETGTGKEVVARALHLEGERRDRPFVALNCGALPKETVESELFGHERGAFTGADRARAGAFEEADGGTLFLDELGDLPLHVQVKLLRTLETGEVRRLGGTVRTVDVRLVSATHHDLAAAMEEGRFREDLYYRLCVALIELPPLRQRLADVVPMAEYFARQFTPGQEPPVLAPNARAKLEGHAWPGNARELRNAVQLALLQRRGPVITAEDVVLRTATKRRRGSDTLRVAGRTMDEIEREVYRLALERHDGDRSAAMVELGVPKSTFFRRLDAFDLQD